MKKSLFAVALLIGAVASTSSFAQSRNRNNNNTQSSAIAIAGGAGGGKQRIVSTVPAYAPGLAVGGIVCEGSTTAAAGATGWGISFGTTRPNRTCDAREWYKTFAASGMGGAATAAACDDDIGGKAIVNSGVRCPDNTLWGQAQAQAEAQLAQAQAAYYAQQPQVVPVASRSQELPAPALPRGTRAAYTTGSVKPVQQAASVEPMCANAMTWSPTMCRNSRPAS